MSPKQCLSSLEDVDATSVHYISMDDDEYNDMVKTLLGDPLLHEDELGDLDSGIFDDDDIQTVTPSPPKKQKICTQQQQVFEDNLLSSLQTNALELQQDAAALEPITDAASFFDSAFALPQVNRSSSPAPSVTSTSPSVNSSSDNEERWNERYSELVEYKSQHGNCNVPYNWPANRTLSQWVKRQRHQYKLRQEGKHSNLTQEREDLLNGLTFVWDSRACHWEDRFGELQAFHKEFGHVRVTQTNKAYRPLAIWLKRQRHQSRLYLEGDTSTGMTLDKMTRLVNLGVRLNVSQSKLQL